MKKIKYIRYVWCSFLKLFHTRIERYRMNLLKNTTAEDALKYAIENGIIDMSYVETQMEMKKREEYLSLHTYKIWKGTDNKWHTYLPDKEKGRIPKKRNTEKEIEDVIIEYWKKQTKKHTIKSTFYEWVTEKLEYGEISKSTYDRYETDFIRFFNPEFAETDLNSITEDQLERFIKTSIKEKGLTAKAFSGLRTLINGIFKYGKKHKYTNISISVFIQDLDLSKRIYAKKVKNAENEVFTEEEIKKMVAYINSREVKMRELGVLLALYTGMRPGELSVLKASDVNLQDKSIHIQRCEERHKDENGKGVYGVKDFPKTDAGDRYLALNDKALEVVEKILSINPDGEFLLEDEITKKRISKNGFNHKLRRICEGVNIHVRTMHKLRKTYGTILINNYVSDSIIKEQMGHSDIKTTRGYYYYSNFGKKEKLEQLNRAFA